MLRAVIADDEAPAREKLRSHLAEFDDIAIVAECMNGRETIAAVRDTKPDLLFLDIQMPELDGFDVLREIEPDERPSAIVFITAYDTFALRAFEVNAIDYLLKPYTRERLADSVARARERLRESDSTREERMKRLFDLLARRSSGSARLPVRTKDGIEFIHIAEINWLQADGNYCRVFSRGTEQRLRGTISEFEAKLGPDFLRVHRSLIVNRESITRIEPWANGEYVIVLRDGTKLNSGRGYGERVRELFA
jgi:two-component system, LytTR family, response regulator